MEFKKTLFNEAFYLINSSNLENNGEDYYSLIQSDANFNKKKRFEFRANIEDYKKAIVLFEQFLETNPDCKLAYNYCGIAKKNTKDYQGAILDYSKAIELDANYATAYSNKGNLRLILREFEEAIKEYTKAISINKKNAQYYDLRGLAKQSLNDISGAIKDYKEVIELEPNNPKYYAAEFFAKETENKLIEAKAHSKNPLIIKAFSEMNTSLLEVLLDDDKTYQNVTKETFIEKMNVIFEQFKEKKDTVLLPYKGRCTGEGCTSKGCTGFSFVGNFSNSYVDIIFEETEKDFIDIYTCVDFKCEDESIVKKQLITLKLK